MITSALGTSAIILLRAISRWMLRILDLTRGSPSVCLYSSLHFLLGHPEALLIAPPLEEVIEAGQGDHDQDGLSERDRQETGTDIVKRSGRLLIGKEEDLSPFPLDRGLGHPPMMRILKSGLRQLHQGLFGEEAAGTLSRG